MKIRILLTFILLCSFSAGCAEMDVPKPKQILKEPLGGGSIKIGMSKDKVLDIYGKPDIVDTVISADWKEPREQWIYTASTSLPVGAGYLSEDLYLYFDGNNVTNISRKALGKISDEGNIK